jgi:long-chain acyl-CoA synthetase
VSNLEETIAVTEPTPASRRKSGLIEPLGNVVEYLLEDKPADPQALLLVEGEHTYGELDAAAREVAAYLVNAGTLLGDRVILIADNSFFWVASYLGILRAGLVCVPLPPRIAPDELAYVLQLTEPVFAFAQLGCATSHQQELSRVRTIVDGAVAISSSQRFLTFSDLRTAGAGSKAKLPEVHPRALAALMFTSGSTGRPRGVKISHANIIANTESIIQCLGLRRADRIMAVLPFHYCFGTSLLHTHLRVGGTVVADSRFRYPEVVLQRMRETACTGFAGVPSHYQILLRRSGLARMKFPALRYVQQAGGPLAPVLVAELRRALPEQQIYLMYGQTEATARLACLPPEFLDVKPGSVGKAIPGVELRVVDSRGKEVGPGEVGEITARGDNIACGYWREPQASAERFRDGWLHTRDLATVASDGFIYIVDRADDFLKCGGKRVSCRLIEEQLLEFEEVLEAAVIGVFDPVLGEAVKAFVVPRHLHSGAFTDALLQFCREHLAPELLPKQIVTTKALPKNSAGKVLKRALREGSKGGDLQA